MAFTNEGKAQQIAIWATALQSATFKIGNAATPEPEAATDSSTVNGGMSAASTVLTFSSVTVEPEPATGIIRVNCIVQEADANGETWTEIALFYPSGDLISREVITTPELKNNAKKLFYTFILDFYA